MVELARFGGGGDTYLHPLTVCAVVLAVILILVANKKYVIVPLLAGFFLIPMNQVLVLGPFHFPMLRVLILFGWVKLVAIKSSSETEIFSGGMNRLDKALILCTVLSAVDFVLLFQETGAVINQLGAMYSIFGIYFLMRFLIRDEADVDRVIRTLAYIAMVVAVIMVFEQLTGRTPYAFLGRSVPIRDGRFRAQAAFGHPILAGTFGAMIFPLFLGLLSKGKNRLLAWAGIIASTLIALASASSTPLLAYVSALFALGLWPLRGRMRMIRWGIALTLISLHLVMKAPVWALIGRVDVIGGNSAAHRYILVDNFIRRFGDWWLLGVKSTTNWGWDMFDLANQYVAVGEVYGLLPFVCFMAIIVYGFKYIGRARKACEGDKKQEMFFWTLGLAMFANCVAFFGISYFDQTMAAWYAFLAIICAATAPYLTVKAEEAAGAALPAGGLRAAYPSLGGPAPAGTATRGGALAKGDKGPGRWHFRNERVR
jgi:hypothetical protein